MSQASIVDAHIQTLVLGFNGREHGQDLLFIGEVTFEGNQGTTIPCTLTLCCQFLKSWGNRCYTKLTHGHIYKNMSTAL